VVYELTHQGRRALADWVDVPGDPPSLEFEALLKVAFADHGSLEGLRANLAAIRGTRRRIPCRWLTEVD